jgi:hypothetical protein
MRIFFGESLDSEKVLVEVFRKFDTDHSGQVEFDEFVSLMRRNQGRVKQPPKEPTRPPLKNRRGSFVFGQRIPRNVAMQQAQDLITMRRVLQNAPVAVPPSMRRRSVLDANASFQYILKQSEFDENQRKAMARNRRASNCIGLDLAGAEEKLEMQSAQLSAADSVKKQGEKQHILEHSTKSCTWEAVDWRLVGRCNDHFKYDTNPRPSTAPSCVSDIPATMMNELRVMYDRRTAEDLHTHTREANAS